MVAGDFAVEIEELTVSDGKPMRLWGGRFEGARPMR